jgi:hypothetical protein
MIQNQFSKPKQQHDYNEMANLQREQIRQLRTHFGSKAEYFIKRSLSDNMKIPVLLLLCPSYPHDGKKFTYKGKMTNDVSPTLPKFIRKINLLMSILSARKNSVEINSLICDIEYDLPSVVEKFTNGSVDEFFDNVKDTSLKTKHELTELYPGNAVNGDTFLNAFGLDEFERYQAAASQFKYPSGFELKKSEIAKNRSEMFSKLYNSNNPLKDLLLADRQLQNYLSTYLAIADKYPDGCLVLNDQSPNLYYIKSQAIVRSISSVENQKLPIFISL